MKTETYTPDPWKVEGQFYDAHRIVDTNGVPICQLWYKDESPMPNQEANAERIVACVNEFTGKTNEEVKGYVSAMDAMYKNYCNLQSENIFLKEEIRKLKEGE